MIKFCFLSFEEKKHRAEIIIQILDFRINQVFNLNHNARLNYWYLLIKTKILN